MASCERQIKRWENLKQPDNKFLTCFICEYSDYNENFKKYYANDIFNAGQIVRHQCPNCDLIFGDLRFLNFSNEEVANDYCDTYSYFKEGDSYKHQLNSLNSIELFKNKNYSYLDYACGIGRILPILRKQGYNIVGYDKYVITENVLNNIDNIKFDVIFSNNYIEHLINPIDNIKQMLEHLNENGYLIFTSDCIDKYKVEITHFHTFYYLGKSLTVLAKKINLNILEIKSVGECRVLVLQKLNR